jgi:hypothetical protein
VDRPWNEIVVDGRGNAYYVNSIGFDMASEAPQPGIIGLVDAQGDLTNRRLWAEIDGYPDGICIDAEVPCGERRCGAACESQKAARCRTASNSTGAASPARWEAQTANAVHHGRPVEWPRADGQQGSYRAGRHHSGAPARSGVSVSRPAARGDTWL